MGQGSNALVESPLAALTLARLLQHLGVRHPPLLVQLGLQLALGLLACLEPCLRKIKEGGREGG